MQSSLKYILLIFYYFSIGVGDERRLLEYSIESHNISEDELILNSSNGKLRFYSFGEI